MAKSVVGLFQNERDAREALREIDSVGLNPDQVSYVDRESNLLAGNLAQVGIPQDDALIYSDGVKRGGVLIVLQALSESAAEGAAGILNRYNLVDVAAGTGGLRASSESTSSSPAAQGSARGSGGNCRVYQGRETVVEIAGEEPMHGGGDEPATGALDRDVAPHPPHENY